MNSEADKEARQDADIAQAAAIRMGADVLPAWQKDAILRYAARAPHGVKSRTAKALLRATNRENKT